MSVPVRHMGEYHRLQPTQKQFEREIAGIGRQIQHMEKRVEYQFDEAVKEKFQEHRKQLTDIQNALRGIETIIP